MNDDLKLAIFNSDIFIRSGEHSTGKIQIITNMPTNISKIDLILKRIYSVKTKLQKLTIDHEQTLYEKEFNVFKSSYKFDTLAAGKHTFPFKIMMEDNRSATVDSQLLINNKNISVKNMYELVANVYYQIDYSEKVKTTSTEVYVYNKIEYLQNTVTKIDFSLFFCLFKTNCLIESILDKKEYFSGEIAELTILMTYLQKNARVKHIEVELYQHSEVKVKNHIFVDQRVIFKTPAYKESGNKKCTVNVAKIRIPFTVPSNTNESHLKLRNFLMIHVFFDRGKPLKITKVIKVIKPRIKFDKNVECNLLDGVDHPMSFFKA